MIEGMSVKFLPVFAIALMVAGCNRQPHSPPAASQTSARDPEPVERPAPPPASARVAGDSKPSPVETRPVEPHPAEAVIAAGTRIRVRMGESLDTRSSRAGARFTAYLDEPLVSGGRVIVPKGTPFRGHVIEAKRSGRLRGRARLGVTLDSFRLHGTTYPVATGADVQASKSHKKRNAIAIGGGSGTGAAIGALAGGGVGILAGAAAGAAAGTTGAFITGRKDVKLPVETPLVFSLRNSVTVRG